MDGNRLNQRDSGPSTSEEVGGPVRLADLECCSDFETAARRCLPQSSWEYISGGEADTMARNRLDFASLMIRPRVLNDVSSVDIRCTLFGSPYATPFYLSSVAKGGLVAKAQGETVFVRAAARAEAAFIVPSVSSLPLPDIWSAARPGQGLPFQFYLLGDEEDSMRRLREAITLGATAVVVTVDANAPRRGSFSAATQASTGVFPSPKLTWQRLADIRDMLPSNMPLYLKGVQTAEDALQAARLGVQGIIVSNHGGRCCADAWGALSALEDVAGALREAGVLHTMELLFDSGVRSGRDALKALCLGATGVGLGRPYYWAAACYREDGIVALLQLLGEELRHAMAQAGAPALAALGPSLLCRASSELRSLSVRGLDSAPESLLRTLKAKL